MHLCQQPRAEQTLHLQSVNKGELSWRRLLTLLERDSDLENKVLFSFNIPDAWRQSERPVTELRMSKFAVR